jgi:hypothetical protein
VQRAVIKEGGALLRSFIKKQAQNQMITNRPVAQAGIMLDVVTADLVARVGTFNRESIPQNILNMRSIGNLMQKSGSTVDFSSVTGENLLVS